MASNPPTTTLAICVPARAAIRFHIDKLEWFALEEYELLDPGPFRMRKLRRYYFVLTLMR